MGRTDFFYQFRKVIIHYKHIGYDNNLMQQTAYLVIYPIIANKFAVLSNCMPVDQGSDSL